MLLLLDKRIRASSSLLVVNFSRRRENNCNVSVISSSLIVEIIEFIEVWISELVREEEEDVLDDVLDDVLFVTPRTENKGPARESKNVGTPAIIYVNQQ